MIPSPLCLSLPAGRRLHDHAGLVYVLGGVELNTTTLLPILASTVLVYDPTKDTWMEKHAPFDAATNRTKLPMAAAAVAVNSALVTTGVVPGDGAASAPLDGVLLLGGMRNKRAAPCDINVADLCYPHAEVGLYYPKNNTYTLLQAQVVGCTRNFQFIFFWFNFCVPD